MTELQDTLKSIQSDLNDVKVSQARMEQDVKYHIRRSDPSITVAGYAVRIA